MRISRVLHERRSRRACTFYKKQSDKRVIGRGMPRTPTQVVETDKEIRRAVRIEPTAIQEEYASLPADLNRWGHLLAAAHSDKERADLDLDTWDANERLRIKAEAEAKNMKITVDTTDALVYANQVYRRLREAVILAEKDKQEIFATVEAIRAKKEMLISLGATMRQEIEGDRELVIRKRRDEQGG